MTDKSTLRAQVIASRRARSAAERTAARAAIADVVLDRCGRTLPPGAVVAAYEPLPSEPGSVELLAALDESGWHVLVPITLADNDLDWVRWTADSRSNPQAGIRTASDPLAGAGLGVGAIGAARLVIVPAFAVDRTGRRLGRGGGSYDRALARVSPDATVAALLFDGELVDEVPVDHWDQPVSAVVTPAGWLDLNG